MKKMGLEKGFLFLLIFAFLIRIYKLSDLMPFYGDVGRDFLIVKEIITEHKFPLFGPPTSLGWLRLGPLVYYLWVLAFFIGGFHPVSIASMVILFDLGTIILIYLFGSRLLNRKKGVIAALLYTFSPLAIFHSRIPLHTSLSPFFASLTIFLFCLWVETKKEKFLYSSFFAAGLMLQTHLVTGIIALCLLLYLFLKEKKIGKIAKSFLFGVVPIMPLLLIDMIQRKFMLAKFIIWIPYRALSFFGIFTTKNIFSLERGLKTIQIFSSSVQKAIFLPNMVLSIFLLLVALVYSFKLAKKSETTRFLITIVSFSFIAFFIHGEPQEHYLIFLVPLFSLLIANFLTDLLTSKLLFIALFLLVLIPAINFVSLIRYHYYMGDGMVFPKFNYGIPLGQQIEIMKFIIKDSDDESYQIVNPPDAMALTTLYENYRYLGWWLGKEEKKDGVLKYRVYGRKHAILPLKEGEEITEFPSTYVVKWKEN